MGFELVVLDLVLVTHFALGVCKYINLVDIFGHVSGLMTWRWIYFCEILIIFFFALGEYGDFLRILNEFS